MMHIAGALVRIEAYLRRQDITPGLQTPDRAFMDDEEVEAEGGDEDGS
jgi:hypothetical protein